MLRPLPTEQHLYTRGSVQRYSHRRVAAHACGICVSLEGVVHRAQDLEMPTSRSTTCAPWSEDRGFGKGLSFPRFEDLQLPVSDTAPVFGGVVLPGVRGRRAISPVFCRRLVRSRRLRPCPKSQGCSARSLGGRESCLTQGPRFGNALCCCAKY